MPTANKDPLFRLIKSLTKPEKRHFRLYVNRTMGGTERKFLVLFDLIDKQEVYDQKQLLKKLPGKTTRSKLSNLKRHLFKQLLTSLRLTYINKLIDIEIREQLDFARILYSKGLYMESLRILERIKDTANEHNQDILHLQILEFQKLIESRHITRSRQVEKKMERLLEESTLRSRITQTASEMVNLYIQIHGYYIVYGFASTPEQKQALQRAWQQMKPEQQHRFSDTFFEKAYRFQSYLWYRYIQLDFNGALSHAQEWVTLFGLHDPMKFKDPDLYLRSLYYLLTLLYLTDDSEQHQKYLQQLNRYVEEINEHLNPNSQHVRFVYQNLSQLNAHFLAKDYQQAHELSKKISQNLAQHRELMDDHRILLFYYKFAAAAFGAGQYETALEHLHPILHQGTKNPLREDIEINARLLELLCLYELDQLDRMGYRLTSFSRSVLTNKQATTLQLATYRLLHHLLKNYATDQQPYLQKQHQFFQSKAALPQEKMFLKYLNVIEWLKRSTSFRS